MTWVETANAIAGAVTAIGAAAAAITAWIGINAWRQEVLGRRRIEVAEQALADIYKARDVLNWVRAPVVFAGEGQSRKPEGVEDEQLKRFRDSIFVPIERINNNSEFLSEIHARRYQVIGLFGADAAKPFDTVQRVKNRVVNAANTFGSSGPFSPEVDRDFRETISGVDDKITRELDGAVELAEDIFRPHIAAAVQRSWRSKFPWLG